MNCLCLEQAGGIMVVDCGTSFPSDDLGVDVWHPDFQYLLDRREQVHGVFLTHGHEDHIGGLPYLLSELSVPVYGPAHAIGLVKRRLVEHDFDLERLDLRVAEVRREYQLGPFAIEPIRVSHSIPDATALAIDTAAGKVLHTGDFDFDSEPLDGELTDQARLEALGDAGLRLLLSDSTNIDVPSRRGTEGLVGRTLERLVLAAERRVFVTLFASNLPRIAALGELARRTGRRICLLGLSLQNQVQLALSLGQLDWPGHLVIAPEQLRSQAPEQILIIAGGTQAERASSMYRLAHGTHRYGDIESGDTVIFSSRVIPGNERPVHDLICTLLRRGALVITRGLEPDVHTSGHASRAELELMMTLLRPQSFVPVHGSLHHLLNHAKLAREFGINDVAVIECGATLRLDERLEAGGKVPVGRVAIDHGGELLSNAELSERGELGRTGFAVVSLVLDKRDRLLLPPTVTGRGIPLLIEGTAVTRRIAGEVARKVERYRGQSASLEEEVRRVARRMLHEETGSRPTVEVHIHHVPA